MIFGILLPVFLGGSSANQGDSEKSWNSNHPNNQEVQQIRVELTMKVQDVGILGNRHAASAFYEGLRDLFMKRYKNEQRFHMSLQVRLPSTMIAILRRGPGLLASYGRFALLQSRG